MTTELNQQTTVSSSQKEHVIFQGTPSHMVNAFVYLIAFGVFLLAMYMPKAWDTYLADIENLQSIKSYYIYIAKAAFFIPWLVIFGFWLQLRAHQYTITNERLREAEGIFYKVTHELELFRVKDITLEQPPHLRMCGCGNIVLDTSDKTTPIVTLLAVKDPHNLIVTLRKVVEARREAKGVREID